MRYLIKITGICGLVISCIGSAAAQPIIGGSPVFVDINLQQCLEEEALAEGWTDTAEVVHLSCPSRRAVTVQGIDTLSNLGELDLRDNNIVNILDLEQLSGLIRLYLSGNAGIQVPDLQIVLGNNAGLTHLGLGDIAINDLYLLPLYNSDPQVNAPYHLVELDVSNTGISNIDRLVEFPDLEMLDVSGNGLLDVLGLDPQNPVLGQLSRLRVLDLGANRLTGLSGVELLTGLTEFSVSGNAGIPLPELQIVLGNNTGLTHLGLGDIAINDLYLLPLYNSDPQVNAPYDLVELDVGNTGIDNIDRLGEFPGLVKLDLSGNGLVDIQGPDPQNPVLGQLLQLAYLDLGNNALTDLPGLSLLNGLTELYLSNNKGIPFPVMNNVLQQNTGLTHLGIGDITIGDLFSLSLFNSDPQVNAPYDLIELDVNNTGIDNIDRLVEFPHLAKLDLSDNRLTDLRGPDPQNPVLQNLTSLSYLDVSNNALTDLTGINLHTGLIGLYLSGNAGIPLPELQIVLANNPGLTHLGLNDIAIDDLYLLPLYNSDPQINAPYDLVELDVANTGIGNIDRLVEFSDLEILDVSGNGLPDVRGLDPQNPVLGQLSRLHVLDLGDNRLTGLPGVELLTGLTEFSVSGNAAIALPELQVVLGNNPGLTHLGLNDIAIDDLYLLPLYNTDPQVNAPYDLVELDVGNTGIGNIDRLVEFPDLAKLDLSDNRLADITGPDPQNPVLGQLSRLQILDVRSNQLQDIPGVKLLGSLTELYLSDNRGIPLPDVNTVLANNTGLIRLGLAEIDIVDLNLLALYDPAAGGSYKLVELELGNTGIDNIDRLVEFPGLVKLDLSDNGLADITGPDLQNPVIARLPDLRELDLSNNRLTDLPGVYQLSGLTRLYLSGNTGIRLPELTVVLANNPGLTHLGLNDIAINDLYLLPLYNSDPQVNTPYDLVELDVGNTGIDNIDRLVEFPHLEILDVSGNGLPDVRGLDPQNPVLGQLSRLRVLDLGANRLSGLSGVALLTGLTEFSVSGNAGIPLTELQVVLGNNTGLTHLGLNDIALDDLYLLPLYNSDPQVNAPYDLVELDVGNTGIDNIDRLVEFPDLEILDLSDNGLADITGPDPQNPVLGQLPQLTYLDLGDNALTDLPGLDVQRNLERLYLSGNAGYPLAEVQIILGNNVNLTHLGLGDIAIGDLDILPMYDPAAASFYKLVELDVGDTGIGNIDRLVEFPNLIRLDLSDNGLNDLTGPDPQTPVLQKLPELTYLDVSGNALTDLPGLDLHTGLVELYLSGNAGIPLSVVQAVLANNTGLTHLGLGDIAIDDLYLLPLFNTDPQVNAPYHLVELDVSNTGISNIDRLVEFPDLVTLDLSDNQLMDLAGPDPQNPVLAQLARLRILNLGNASLMSTNGLDMLAWLDELDLSGNSMLECDDLTYLGSVLVNTTIAYPALCVSPDGDINEDGKVDLADVLMCYRVLLNNGVLTGSQMGHADVAPLVGGIPSSDGLFTPGDLVVIMSKVTGAISF